MKTKFLLTVLFSIGIIGIASAQGLAKNDRFHGPRETVVIKHEPRRTVVEHRMSRHERREMRRAERRQHRRMFMRHHRHF